MWDWGRSGGCRVAGPVGRVHGRVPSGSAGPVEAGGGAGVRGRGDCTRTVGAGHDGEHHTLGNASDGHAVPMHGWCGNDG